MLCNICYKANFENVKGKQKIIRSVPFYKPDLTDGLGKNTIYNDGGLFRAEGVVAGPQVVCIYSDYQ